MFHEFKPLNLSEPFKGLASILNGQDFLTKIKPDIVRQNDSGYRAKAISELKNLKNQGTETVNNKLKSDPYLAP